MAVDTSTTFDPWAGWKPPTVTPFNPNVGASTPTSTTSANTGGTTGGSVAYPTDIQKQMDTNSQAWNNTTDQTTRDYLHNQNLQLGAQTGMQYDTSGVWKPSQSLPGYSYLDTLGHPVQQDGSLHLNVNGKSQSDVPVYQGTSYTSAQDLAQKLGMDYAKDPKTGQITIGGKQFNPIGYDKSGNPTVGVRDVAEALGYQVGYDPKTSSVSITDKQGGGQGGGFGQSGSYMDSLLGAMPQQPGISPYTPPDLSWFSNQMMPYGTFNNNMDSYYQQAHNQLDPQYNTQYQNLQTQENNQLKAADESMNRRGIYSSGIAQAAENDLRAKTSGAVATLFSKQMGDIAKTAQNLYDTAFKQYQSGNASAMKNNEFMMTQMMNQQKQSFAQWLQTQKLDQSQYNYALSAWDKMAILVQKDVQFNQTQDWNQYKFGNLSADQNATLTQQGQKMEQDWAKTLLPYQQMTQYQQGQMNQGQQKIDIQQAAQQAANYFKQLGYNLDVGKLEEVIRHNQAGETLASQKLSETIANNKQNFDEKVRVDDANIAKAQDAATDNMKKIQISGYRTELSNITSQINNYTATGKPAPSNLITNYNNLMQKVEAVVGGGNGG